MDHFVDDRRYLIPFRAALLPQIFIDVLVVGMGVAGLRAALAASAHSDVIVVSKGDTRQSNTYMAQGGVAAVWDQCESDVMPSQLKTPCDSFDLHARDTTKAGAGLCDVQVVHDVVQSAPVRIQELLNWRMRFDHDRSGHTSMIARGREGGHSAARVLHADGDATGKELIHTLWRQVQQSERVRLFNQCFVLDLITVDHPSGPCLDKRRAGQTGGGGRCIGAITHHPQYGLQVIWAEATILACGGSGQVYRESTNATAATGDGLAAAYRAGAQLADMAFVQFHPTTLYVAGAARSLVSEAVRGEGALLKDRNGYRFMPDYDKRAELAPRDVVSRSILAQMAKTHFTHVYLDCRPIGSARFAKRFPGIYAFLKQFGIDPGHDPVPIHPSAHYMVGGVYTDPDGRTDVDGLYACGEVACTGLHGANRLASNSLLEGLVFGERTGRICQEMRDPGRLGPTAGGRPPKIVSDIRPSDRSGLDVADVRSSLRSVLWRHVGIVRTGDRLAEVREMFEFWSRYTLDKIFDDRQGWEVQNMLLVGSLITRSAQWRKESRGTHFRTDYPETLDAWRCHDLWRRGSDAPVPMSVKDATPVSTG